MKKICVLVSGSGTNLQRIIDTTTAGEIKNSVVTLVIADRACYAMHRAAKYGIRNILVPRGTDLSKKLLEIIPAEIDLIVLAGFLSILETEFCEHFRDKIINIHPALLPKYGGKGMWGAHVHEAVLAAKENKSGVTIHYVTPGIDEGKIILQKSFEINHGDTAEILAEKVHEIEYDLLPKAIDRLLNIKNKVAFISDLHMREKSVEKKGVNTTENWKTVLRDMQKKGITHIIFGGDLGEKEALEIIFDDVKDLHVEVILGNHDKIELVAPYFIKADKNKELFYSTQIFGRDCIFLDTSSYKLSSTQLKFLKNRLTDLVNPIIFIHHPILGDKSWMDKKHPLKNRDEVKKILREREKSITIISGHYHHFHDVTLANMRQIIAPAVSYQILNLRDYLADIQRFGYLLLDFSDETVQVEQVILKI